MEDHFRVAAGLEAVPGFQPTSDLRIVVDLPVEGDPYRIVLVRHRLPAALEVDDRKPAMAQPHESPREDPLPVRPAMRDRGGHAIDRSLRGSFRGYISADSAHIFPL